MPSRHCSSGDTGCPHNETDTRVSSDSSGERAEGSAPLSVFHDLKGMPVTDHAATAELTDRRRHDRIGTELGHTEETDQRCPSRVFAVGVSDSSEDPLRSGCAATIALMSSKGAVKLWKSPDLR